jgi:hypothetical protein
MEGGREANYWPGFVDALSNVVLTLVFVLVIFVFALLMASNKVKAKMTEVEADDKQLHQALTELQQLKDQENDPKQPSTSCVRFNKSDVTQKFTVADDGESILILFGTNAITVTDDTNKAIKDFLDAYRAKSSNAHPHIAIVSTDDPNAMSPLMAKETQLGRMLNVRNTLLSNTVQPSEIAVRSIPAEAQQDSYNWVKINVEK